MITPEMYNQFDWSVATRRMHYGQLMNALMQSQDMLYILSGAQSPDAFLDLALADRNGEFWMPLSRPGIPDRRPDLPRRDLDLVEFLIEWATGVRNHAQAEIIEMDHKYPELRKLTGTQLLPVDLIYHRIRPVNWLKRRFNAIFK
jgi:hypothetical protein